MKLTETVTSLYMLLYIFQVIYICRCDVLPTESTTYDPTMAMMTATFRYNI